MVIHHHVEGYENFCDFMKKFDSKDQLVHILFSGSKLPSGESWCSDCVEADPAINESLKFAPENSNFIHCEVGDRAYWKDPNNSFRKDANTKLNVLPTIIRWKSPQRLEGEQCGKLELLEMLFTDE